MKTTLYTATIPHFIKSLKNLDGFIGKAIAHAEQKKFDPEILLQSRLAPDQMPFIKQVQLASDQAKGLAPRLMGEKPESLPDTESTIAELRARIHKTIEILEKVRPEDMDGKEDFDDVQLPYMPGKRMTGASYTFELSIPNFYFHITTAYAILRHNGIDLGKMDFLGQIPLMDVA